MTPELPVGHRVQRGGSGQRVCAGASIYCYVGFSFRRCKRVPGTRQSCRDPRPAARHGFPAWSGLAAAPRSWRGGARQSSGFSLSHFRERGEHADPAEGINFDVFRRLFIYLSGFVFKKKKKKQASS